MYKAQNKPIIDFIENSNLLKPDGLICFDAKVVYFIDNRTEIYKCEVNIVTIKNKELDVIYIFNSDLSVKRYKDMFQIQNGRFEYIENKCLIITEDNVTISIAPLNSNCDEKQLLKHLTDYLNKNLVG